MCRCTAQEGIVKHDRAGDGVPALLAVGAGTPAGGQWEPQCRSMGPGGGARSRRRPGRGGAWPWSRAHRSTGRCVAPLLAVGETALVLEELRAVREELRHALAEQLLWLQVVYAEVRAQAAYPSQAHEAAACARAGEQLVRMKELVAEKLKG